MSAGIDAVGIVSDFEEYLKAVGLVVAMASWILAAHAAVLVAATPRAVGEPDAGRLEEFTPTHH